MAETTQKTVAFDSSNEEKALLGSNDLFLKRIRDAFSIRVSARNQVVKLRGDAKSVDKATHVLDDMIRHYRRSQELQTEDVERYIHDARLVPSEDSSRKFRAGAGAWVEPRTSGQERYVRAMEENDIVFCIGPAGTGKTYLAVAMGLRLLQSGDVKKIILVRPAVEAGEKLGYLPGDLQEKVNPYLRPLYDALQDMLDYMQFKRYMERDIIEVVPLAFMRGRTLNHAFVILDEAQNTTGKQMKMFLTRLGAGSSAVITGDITQVDLHDDAPSGLLEVRRILKNIPALTFVYLDQSDVIRHRIVQDIVVAYERSEGKEKEVQDTAAIEEYEPPTEEQAPERSPAVVPAIDEEELTDDTPTAPQP